MKIVRGVSVSYSFSIKKRLKLLFVTSFRTNINVAVINGIALPSLSINVKWIRDIFFSLRGLWDPTMHAEKEEILVRVTFECNKHAFTTMACCEIERRYSLNGSWIINFYISTQTSHKRHFISRKKKTKKINKFSRDSLVHTNKFIKIVCLSLPLCFHLILNVFLH